MQTRIARSFAKDMDTEMVTFTVMILGGGIAVRLLFDSTGTTMPVRDIASLHHAAPAADKGAAGDRKVSHTRTVFTNDDP